jgi:hypothetical protein
MRELDRLQHFETDDMLKNLEDLLRERQRTSRPRSEFNQFHHTANGWQDDEGTYWYEVREEFERELRERKERMERMRAEQAKQWDAEQQRWERERTKREYTPPPQTRQEAPRSTRDFVIEKNLVILGLPKTCRNFDEIKRHYRTLAKKWHPDNNSSPDANQKTQLYLAAYRAIEDVMK